MEKKILLYEFLEKNSFITRVKEKLYCNCRALKTLKKKKLKFYHLFYEYFNFPI